MLQYTGRQVAHIFERKQVLHDGGAHRLTSQPSPRCGEHLRGSTWVSNWGLLTQLLQLILGSSADTETPSHGVSLKPRRIARVDRVADAFRPQREEYPKSVACEDAGQPMASSRAVLITVLFTTFHHH